MAQLKNLTPHTLNIHLASGEVKELLPEPKPARVANSPGECAGELEGIPVYLPDMVGEVENLPPPQEGVWLVVSAIVAAATAAAAVRPTRDILVPGTGPLDSPVRKDGRVVGITRLKQV